MASSKRMRTVDDALPTRPADKKREITTQATSAPMAVLGNVTLLRCVTAFQRGVPVALRVLEETYGMTPDARKEARKKARDHAGLAGSKHISSGRFYRFPSELPILKQLKRAKASYMEMAIELGDLRMLQMLYKLTSRRNYASIHPRLRFRNPMRHAAAYGRLEMLQWLKGRKERDKWLEDPWLLSFALESFDLAIVQWVHQAYEGDETLVVRWKRLDEAAERGKLELL